MIKLANSTIALLRNLKIRNRLAAYLLISLFIISMSILLFSRSFAYNLTNRYVHNYVKSAQEQIITSIELLTNEVTMLTVRLQTNQDIYNLLGDDSITYGEKLERLKQLLDGLLSYKDTVGDIVIVTNDGEVYEYDNELKVYRDDEDYISRIDVSQTPVWGIVRKDATQKAYIPFGVKYNNFYTSQKLGYLIIYIREDALYDVYKEIVPDWGYSFILTENDCILSHQDKNKIGYMILDGEIYEPKDIFKFDTGKFDGEMSVIASSKLNQRMKSLGADWRIVSVISYNKLFEVISKINMSLLLIGVGMLLTGILVSMIMSKKITTSLDRLKKKLNAFGSGNLSAILEEGIRDEIWELEKSYNSMVVRINDLIEKNNEEKEKQRELELIALQAQINPHFLYNTLDAIGCIAKLKNRQDDIELLVLELAKFFRLSLHKGDKFIMVEEEIQLVQSFVTIEQMRSPGKFDVTYNISEEINKIKMLKITLQPLVENAIKHGFFHKRGKGNIVIKGFRTGDTIRFQVIDDGVGFDVKNTDLRCIRSSFSSNGYGLYNVDERIKLEYGDSYGLTIESEIGKGTTVEVSFSIKV